MTTEEIRLWERAKDYAKNLHWYIDCQTAYFDVKRQSDDGLVYFDEKLEAVYHFLVGYTLSQKDKD